MNFCVPVVIAFLAAAPALAAEALPEDQKVFYALGIAMGQNVGNFSLTSAELKTVVRGLTDQVEGRKPLVDMAAHGPKIRELETSRRASVMDKEKKRGQDYADTAAKEKGAERLASGLIYRELVPGNGRSPAATNTIKAHYRGTLIDGAEFDSSYKRGAPTEFPLNGVIPCWTEGLQRMKTGGKSRLVCPAAIAYGDRGAPPNIPGGATLVFDVELVEIVK